MNVRHITKALANTRLPIIVYFSLGARLINFLLTLISTAGMFITIFLCEQLCIVCYLLSFSVFFGLPPFVQTYVCFAPSVKINILLCVWKLLKSLLQVHFRRCSTTCVHFLLCKKKKTKKKKLPNNNNSIFILQPLWHYRC